MEADPHPFTLEALRVIKQGPLQAELRVTTSDEAASLLWAAQWLDEHREYSVTAIHLDTHRTADAPDDDTTTTLVIALHLVNEPMPGHLGPWAHGVPATVPSFT